VALKGYEQVSFQTPGEHKDSIQFLNIVKPVEISDTSFQMTLPEWLSTSIEYSSMYLNTQLKVHYEVVLFSRSAAGDRLEC
jgi:hypothetical protein